MQVKDLDLNLSITLHISKNFKKKYYTVIRKILFLNKSKITWCKIGMVLCADQ